MGCLLGILVPVAIYFVLWGIGLGIEALTPWFLSLPQSIQDAATILFVVSFAIGLNVLSYFVAFKWTGKKWFFFVSIILTLALFCLAQAS